MSELRAITIRPPWSDAVVDGFKTTENRRGGFPSKYRGELLIHSGLQWSTRGQHDPRIREVYATELGPRSSPAWAHVWAGFAKTAGYIIGIAELVDVHPAAGECCAPWGELQYTEDEGTHRTDILHLTLEHAQRLEEPIRARGALGLWRPTLDTLNELEGELNYDDDFADAPGPTDVDVGDHL